MGLAYYNEFEPYAAEWLGNLIDRGLITDGTIDARSIRDVTPQLGIRRAHTTAPG
jgi:DNA (cytosine-5)-methyltransferase 1